MTHYLKILEKESTKGGGEPASLQFLTHTFVDKV